jgi:hypothetical protein
MRSTAKHLILGAVVCAALGLAAVPAEAGRRTGTWKYWNPNMAYAAPPYWYAHPQARRYSRGYGPPAYQGYGYGPPYGRAYGYRRHHQPYWGW